MSLTRPIITESTLELAATKKKEIKATHKVLKNKLNLLNASLTSLDTVINASLENIAAHEKSKLAITDEITLLTERMAYADAECKKIIAKNINKQIKLASISLATEDLPSDSEDEGEVISLDKIATDQKELALLKEKLASLHDDLKNYNNELQQNIAIRGQLKTDEKTLTQDLTNCIQQFKVYEQEVIRLKIDKAKIIADSILNNKVSVIPAPKSDNKHSADEIPIDEQPATKKIKLIDTTLQDNAVEPAPLLQPIAAFEVEKVYLFPMRLNFFMKVLDNDFEAAKNHVFLSIINNEVFDFVQGRLNELYAQLTNSIKTKNEESMHVGVIFSQYLQHFLYQASLDARVKGEYLEKLVNRLLEDRFLNEHLFHKFNPDNKQQLVIWVDTLSKVSFLNVITRKINATTWQRLYQNLAEKLADDTQLKEFFSQHCEAKYDLLHYAVTGRNPEMILLAIEVLRNLFGDDKVSVFMRKFFQINLNQVCLVNNFNLVKTFIDTAKSFFGENLVEFKNYINTVEKMRGQTPLNTCFSIADSLMKNSKQTEEIAEFKKIAELLVINGADLNTVSNFRGYTAQLNCPLVWRPDLLNWLAALKNPKNSESQAQVRLDNSSPRKKIMFDESKNTVLTIPSTGEKKPVTPTTFFKPLKHAADKFGQATLLINKSNKTLKNYLLQTPILWQKILRIAVYYYIDLENSFQKGYLAHDNKQKSCIAIAQFFYNLMLAAGAKSDAKLTTYFTTEKILHKIHDLDPAVLMTFDTRHYHTLPISDGKNSDVFENVFIEHLAKLKGYYKEQYLIIFAELINYLSQKLAVSHEMPTAELFSEIKSQLDLLNATDKSPTASSSPAPRL